MQVFDNIKQVFLNVSHRNIGPLLYFVPFTFLPTYLNAEDFQILRSNLLKE